MNNSASIFDWYFLPKTVEASGAIYRSLGVGIFAQLVRATAGRFVLQLRPKKELYAYFVVSPRSIESISRTERWSRFNESVHLLFLIFCIVMAVIFLKRGQSDGSLIMVLFGLLNLYLTMLQRYNRTRLYRMISLQQARRNRST